MKLVSNVKSLKERIVQKYDKKIVLTISLIVVCFFTFNLGGLINGVWTSLTNFFSNVNGEIKQIIINSEDYESYKGGSVQLIKSADWTSSSTAQLLYKIDTNIETNNIKKDVVIVLDTSISMEGSRLSNMKEDVNELITALLFNSSNKVSIITFNTDSKILTELTNDETVLKDAINDIEASGDTNYYKALLNVEKVLDGYEEQVNRELIILFLTDGYPNIDSPNHIAQYKTIKAKYPYAKVYGIDYETGASIIEVLETISDEQFVANTLNNALIEAALSPEYYEVFEVVEYIDNKYFYVNSVDDIVVSMGKVTLTEEDDIQKITWTASSNEFRTGNEATMTIDLKLKQDLIEVEGLYPTSAGGKLSFKLYGNSVESIESNAKTILKNGYKVTYDANAPEGCNVSIDLEETHFAKNTVTITPEKLKCEGYTFKGWDVSEYVDKINDDNFIMPTHNVIVRGQWTKLELNKTMDGTVYEKLNLYKTIARKAVPDNIKSEYVTSLTGINFKQISSNTNGKGVYTLSSTINDEYPVYYYRGNVTDNNVVFANYCWKIVRTTNTGGVKLIYNGTPTVDGKCTNTKGSSTQLSKSKAFNSNNSSLASSGYMYDATAAKNYAGKSKDFDEDESILAVMDGMESTAYYYSDKEPIYDGEVYKLDEGAKIYTWESNYDSLSGYYTCFSDTTGECNKVYYITFTDYSYAYYLELSDGKSLDEVDIMTFSTDIKDNGDGTYTLLNPSSIKKSEWNENYYYYRNYYICSDHTSTTCENMRYIIKTSDNGYNYSTMENNFVYGNSVEYIYDDSLGKYVYVLQDKEQFWSWSENQDKLTDHHYTCWNDNGVCETVSYIYGARDNTAYYINLTEGKTVEDAIDEMLNSDLTTESTNSTIKEYIDNTWYASNMTDYTKYLENTIWCNDRSIYQINGWNPNGDSIEPYLYFNTYKRVKNTYEPSLNCDLEDSFTLSSDHGGVDGYGNNALIYPVGLLTVDEVMLAGRTSNTNNSSHYLYTGQSNYSMSMAYYYASSLFGYQIHSNGSLYSDSASFSRSIRPSVSLKPDIEYSTGDGTSENPYVIDLNSIE